MKTKEELNALKEEVETVNKKLHELTEDELAQVSGGAGAMLIGPFGPIWVSGLSVEDAIKLHNATLEYAIEYLGYDPSI